jgi:ADP-ribose pyrophosphatase YjhB (NUDIX family)
VIKFHPKTNDKKQPVKINSPSTATVMSSWTNPTEIATVVPDGTMPHLLNGLAFLPWPDFPTSSAGWEKLIETKPFNEPAFQGKKPPASGVVTVEPDGRVWIVSPTNKYGGYEHTFPKGKLDKVKLSFRANALKEAFEESGLHVELIAYLCDSERDTSTTRFYLARRIGGSPAEMDWESQAVSLVPRNQLAKFVIHENDKAVLDALDRNLPVAPQVEDLMKSPALTSGRRILATINGFRRRYGSWPTLLRLDRGVANALQDQTLTATAWLMLEAKMRIVLIDQGTIIAENNCQQFEYDANHTMPLDGERADIWIWGHSLY